jgi:riboflavin synthase
VFTGLIDNMGAIDRIADIEAGRELRVRCGYEELVEGESIAVNGACLTVRESGPGWFTAAAVATTLDRTAIGSWKVGRKVNLERAMRVGDRLGGHLVQGHVDGTGLVTEVRRVGDALVVVIAVDEGLDELFAPLGSVTVDGVSLTVNGLPSPAHVEISLIEYTLRHTTFREVAVGDVVHVEADMLAKHVRRLLAPHLARLSRLEAGQH